MSIFDGIRQSASNINVELDIQHCLTIILLGGVYSDDWESQEELLVVRQVMAKSPIFEDSDDASDRLIIQRCKAYMSSEGNAVDTAINNIPEHLKETAFAMATEIVFADGIIDPKEAAFIENIAEKLAIEKTLARSIVQTFDILFRGIDNKKRKV